MTQLPASSNSADPQKDRWLPVYLAGLLMMLVGGYGLDAPPNQPFADFITQSQWTLALILMGMLTALVGIVAAPGRAQATMLTGGREFGGSRRRFKRRPIAGGILLGAGMACFGYTVRDTLKTPTGLDGPAAFFATLGFIFAGAVLFEQRRPFWRDMQLVRGHPISGGWFKTDGFWLVIAVASWMIIQTIHLDTQPGFFNIDEGMIVNNGHAPYAPRAGEPVMVPWSRVFQPLLSCVPRALFQDLFPSRPFLGPRLLSVIVGGISLALIFFVGRALGGRMTGWIAVLLMAFNHVYLSLARYGLNNLDAVALVALWTLALHGAWRARRVSLALLAGMLGGLAFYSYYLAVAVIPIALGLLVYRLLARPAEAGVRWRLVILYGLGFAIAYAPHFIYFRLAKFPDFDPNWYSRMVFLLSRSNLEAEFARTGVESLPQLMLGYAWPSIGGIFLWPHSGAITDYFDKILPMIDRGVAVLALLGLLVGLALGRRRFLGLAIALWLICGGILPSWLTLYAPYAPRLPVTVAAASILAAWMGSMGVVRVRKRWGWKIAAPLLLAVIVWAGMASARHARQYYGVFIHDKSLPLYRMPWGFADFLKDFPPDAHLIYYVADPYSQMHNSMLKMFDMGFTRQVLNGPGPLPPPSAQASRTAYVFEIAAFYEMEQILRQHYPTAQPIDLVNPLLPDDPPKFRAYWVDRSPAQ